jgi:peptide deformylase
VAEAGEIRTDELDDEREARRRVALAQIRQYPDPVLRMRAHEVEQFDGELAQLVERMTSLMGEAAGVGLAANQVGVLQRVFVFQPSADEGPRAIVNPEIVERAEDEVADDEGCLSMQGVLVSVEGRDPSGEEVRLELEDMAARVVQHELDHLDGVLIIDRTTAEGRRGALAVLRQAI